MKRTIVRSMFSALLLTLAIGPAEAGTRRAIAGGMFADALPGGVFAVPAGGAVVTHAGLVPMPPGGVLFARVTTVGGFRIAVKAHDTDRVLVWAGAGWVADGRISHGTQGHIWTDGGELVVLEPCADCESQGIRWWEGGPVLGSPTYNPFTELAQRYGVRLLYEWTVRDGIAIGQGEEGGAVIQFRGRHYLLEPGDARFIQFHKAGDELAVAITKFREREAVLHWLTTGEIEALPAYVPPAPAPAPVPLPPSPPAPTSPAPPSPQPSQLATVQRIRAAYPTPLGARHWEFLVAVAQATGCQLFRKDGGDRVFVPALNLSVSQDIIICAPEWVDILGDGEGAAIPDWAAHANAGEPEKWIDVRGVALPGAGPRPPEPAPAGVTRVELEAALAQVRSEVVTAVVLLRDRLREEVARLEAQIAAARPLDLTALTAAIDQALAQLVVTGKTRVTLGHQHDVGELRVIRRRQP